MEDFASKFADSIGISVEKPVVAEPDKEVVDKPVVAQESLPTDKVDEPKEVETSDPKVDEPKERDFEKDAAFAKLRREKEALEKKQKQEQLERDKWYVEQFAEYGVTSESDYRNKLKEQREADLLEKAESGDTSAVEELASLKADEIVNEKLREKELALELEREVLDLNKTYDLKLNSIDDLATLERGPEIIAIMQTKKPNGDYFSAAEAYKMANVDLLIAQAQKSAKQQVKNEQSGFNHTKVESKGGAEHSDLTLSAEVMAEFDKWGLKPNMDFLKKVMK